MKNKKTDYKLRYKQSMEDLENIQGEESLDGKESLDLSWVKEEEKYLDTNNYQIRKLESLTIWYVYISSKMVVEKREIDTVNLDTSDAHVSVLDKDVLLHLVQNHKHKYKLMDIQLFHLPLNNENIQSFSSQTIQKEIANQYFKQVNVLNNVCIEPTIVLLHEVSAIYVFYKQCEPENIQIKSILKPMGGNSGLTKKVRIICDNENETERVKQTVRRRLTRKKR
jgi:hypothetical protein